MSAIALFALFSLACRVCAAPSYSNDLTHQLVLSESQEGWFDPRDNGGRLLDYTTEIYGEPLNVIISGQSDPFILTDHGFTHYTKSLGYSKECLGLHLGDRHGADLGDGEGIKIQQVIVRQHYFPVWGTCWESLAGESLVQSCAPSLTVLQGATTSGHGNKMARLPTVVPGLSEHPKNKTPENTT
ncbi:hypothetical protein APHAL10511_002750 [Amanita phalloides]|nr:hypothetical protein APHAL10511_002750 [Amanita phalloides]